MLLSCIIFIAFITCNKKAHDTRSKTDAGNDIIEEIVTPDTQYTGNDRDEALEDVSTSKKSKPSGYKKKRIKNSKTNKLFSEKSNISNSQPDNILETNIPSVSTDSKNLSFWKQEYNNAILNKDTKRALDLIDIRYKGCIEEKDQNLSPGTKRNSNDSYNPIIWVIDSKSGIDILMALLKKYSFTIKELYAGFMHSLRAREHLYCLEILKNIHPHNYDDIIQKAIKSKYGKYFIGKLLYESVFDVRRLKMMLLYSLEVSRFQTFKAILNYMINIRECAAASFYPAIIDAIEQDKIKYLEYIINNADIDDYLLHKALIISKNIDNKEAEKLLYNKISKTYRIIFI